ncbi:ferritin-like domain-containing protein [Fundidesulfovibrio terrae]|uniref:ferritin-like domain-containing protein n=1 Tax=Fundidesulfovibrio terrae TaxID=2922866 RepID=UPI001FAF5FDD|nr:ferritin-like domain-containing protein [Fundidesulfovibrio terrae]
MATDTNSLTRRQMLSGTVLSCAGIAAGALAPPVLLAGTAQAAGPSGDVGILNVALGLEHEGIAAYQLGAESKLLTPEVLKTAVKFQDDHKVHRDLLIDAIKKLGGKPVEAKSMPEYAKALNAASLKSQEDVLKLALRLELGAINAYLGVIPSFADRGLAKVSGRLSADETVHWTTLESVLGLPLPKAMQFGA